MEGVSVGVREVVGVGVNVREVVGVGVDEQLGSAGCPAEAHAEGQVQAVQRMAPAGEKVPAGHWAHAVLPAALLYEPAGQAAHAEMSAPKVAPYVPAAQETHDAFVGVEEIEASNQVPRGHGAHTLDKEKKPTTPALAMQVGHGREAMPAAQETEIEVNCTASPIGLTAPPPVFSHVTWIVFAPG